MLVPLTDFFGDLLNTSSQVRSVLIRLTSGSIGRPDEEILVNVNVVTSPGFNESVLSRRALISASSDLIMKERNRLMSEKQ